MYIFTGTHDECRKIFNKAGLKLLNSLCYAIAVVAFVNALTTAKTSNMFAAWL